jgi:hypothetical protein
MKLLLLFLVFFITQITASQETVWKMKHAGLSNEEYYVLKSDKKIKHGSYVKYSVGAFNKVIINQTGQYYQNQKDSIWKRFYYNEIEEELTYCKGKLEGKYSLFYIDTTCSSINYNMKKQAGFKRDTLIVDLNKENVRNRITGNYHDDRKVGIWNYYYPDEEIFFQFNYNDSMVIYDKRDSLFNVKINEPLNFSKPVYLGGGMDGLLYELVPQLLKYITEDSLSVTFKFLINGNGLLEQKEILNSPYSKQKERKIINSINLSDNWIPLKVNRAFRTGYRLFEIKIKRNINELSFNFELISIN